MLKLLACAAALAASSPADAQAPAAAAAEPAASTGSGVAPAAEAPPQPAPRRRPRRRPRYKNLGKKEPPSRLKSKEWAEPVKKALERLLEAKGSHASGYNADWPPVAVLVLDDVAVRHHAGEAAFQRLVERVEFKFSEDWWNALPPAERARGKRAHKRFTQTPEATWSTDPDYQEFRKAMYDAYERVCREDGKRRCRAWLTGVLTGYTEGEVEAYMRDAVEEALREPLETVQVVAYAGDEKPVAVRRGLRRLPAISELAGELLRGGFDVWAVSSSNQWAAEALARRYGIDASRVVGMRPKVINKLLRPEVVDPVTEGAGKAEAVTLFVGRDPDLILAGAAEPELLGYGKGERVAIDSGDELFAALARSRGWLLQPSLAPGLPEALE